MRGILHILAQSALFPAPGAVRADTSELGTFENPRALRRVAHFCRLGLLAAHRCFAAAGAKPDPSLGLIIASGYGPIRTSFDFSDSIQDFGTQLASPTAFSTSVYNIAASTISLYMGITGPVHTLSQGPTSFIAALDLAWTWLHAQRARQVLLGVLDEYDPTLEHFVKNCPEARQHPPCEGALFLLLGKEEPGVKKLGTLSEWAMGCGPLNPKPKESLTVLDQDNPHYAPGHPAGPVRNVARLLESPGGGAALCRSRSPDGWWSAVRYDPPKQPEGAL